MDLRDEFKDLRERFKNTSREEFATGNWFAKMSHWVLETHASNATGDYVRHKYAGAGPGNQSRKAIKLASRHAAIVGGLSAAAVTALEVSVLETVGLDSPLALPAIAGSVMADIAVTTRIQLRSTYDLSVIHKAPLQMEDPDDCYFVFMAALGVKSFETAGNLTKTVGPRVVAYNVRKLLRSGLRATLVQLLKKVAGTRIAKLLTERALMRVLVPGVSVPISASANYLFTRSMLRTANKHMERRGAVVRPLLRLYKANPELPQLAAPKALIVVLQAPQRDWWGEGPLQALRHTQSTLGIDDAGLQELDDWCDRTPEQAAEQIPTLAQGSGEALFEYLATAAALGASEHDEASAAAIRPIASHVGVDYDEGEIRSRIEAIRRRLE